MSLLDDVIKLEKEAIERIGQADSLDALNDLKIQYIGRKGSLVAILRGLGKLPDQDRKEVGAKANQIRAAVTAEFETKAQQFSSKDDAPGLDPTLPGTGHQIGAEHIINQTMN